MKKRVMPILLAVPALLALAGCPGASQVITQKVVIDPKVLAATQPSPSADPEATALIQVIHDNATALNGNDRAKFIATLHPDSGFASDAGFYERLHDKYQTRYNVVETKIQSQSADIATVVVKRRTSDYTGTIEQDVLYTLRKQDKNWKIFEMVEQARRPVS